MYALFQVAKISQQLPDLECLSVVGECCLAETPVSQFDAVLFSGKKEGNSFRVCPRCGLYNWYSCVFAYFLDISPKLLKYLRICFLARVFSGKRDAAIRLYILPRHDTQLDPLFRQQYSRTGWTEFKSPKETSIIPPTMVHQ